MPQGVEKVSVVDFHKIFEKIWLSHMPYLFYYRGQSHEEVRLNK